MKVLRIFISILVLLVIVLGLTMAGLYYFIDPNKLKPVLYASVQKQTGYKLLIDGDLSWSFYPVLGVKVQHATLSEPNQAVPFLELRDVTFASAFSQLLHGINNLQGDVYSAEVRLSNLHANALHVGLHWENNVLTLQPIRAILYKGILTGIAHGRDFSTSPRWNFQMEAKQVALHQLLEEVNGPNSKIKISGISDLKLQGQTTGKAKDVLIKNFHGTAEFSLNQGIIEGFDLNYLIHTADALINREKISMPETINQTSFDSLSGAALIQGGIATTHNLLLTAPAFIARGDGNIEMLSQDINFKLQVTPKETLKTKWIIPVIITGNLSSPSVRLDMTLLENLIEKEKIDKVKEKVQEEIKKLPEKADKFIKNLLGQ